LAASRYRTEPDLSAFDDLAATASGLVDHCAQRLVRIAAGRFAGPEVAADQQVMSRGCGASHARLYQRLPLNDDGPVMQLSDQTLFEFAVLTLSGIVWSAVTALLVTDYRGTLTSYTHSCWLTYQRPWYQRTFLRTASSRARHADENRLRRTFRIVARHRTRREP